MSIHVSALVVAPDDSDRAALVEALRHLGVAVHVAADFGAARDLLAAILPDVLITELRLGAYNGLHLVLRCKAVRPQMRAIVLTRAADPVLEREAEQLDAELVVKEGAVDWISRILATLGPVVGNGRLVTKPADGA